jgi:hypothetical protein
MNLKKTTTMNLILTIIIEIIYQKQYKKIEQVIL